MPCSEWREDNEKIGTPNLLFESKADLRFNPEYTDAGLFVYAHEFLRPYARSHTHALVILDEQFPGSPGPEEIESRIGENLVNSGWPRERFEVIVIVPELESWIFTGSSHVDRVLGFEPRTLRSWLAARGHWAMDAGKPRDPKKALEVALRGSGKLRYRTPRSSALYHRIIERSSVRACTDPAFLKLRDTLRRWFPPEVAGHPTLE